MADTEKEQSANDVEKVGGEVSPKAEIDETEKRYRAELAGLNRKISELEKANKDKELEKLSETERAKEEARIAQEERDKYIAETVELKKTTAVLNEGLSKDFAQFITGKDDESIKAQIEVFKATVSAEADKLYKAQAAKNFGGRAPAGGQTPESGSLQTQLDDAKKSGNTALATAIRRKASADGVQLNG